MRVVVKWVVGDKQELDVNQYKLWENGLIEIWTKEYYSIISPHSYVSFNEMFDCSNQKEKEE